MHIQNTKLAIAKITIWGFGDESQIELRVYLMDYIPEHPDNERPKIRPV